MVVFVNLGLRPLVKWLKKRTNAGVPLVGTTASPSCRADQRRGAVTLLRTIGLSGFHLSEIELRPTDAGGIDLCATVLGEGLLDHDIKNPPQGWLPNPVCRVRWQVLEDL